TEAQPSVSPSTNPPLIIKELWAPFRNEKLGLSLNIGTLKRISNEAQSELPSFEASIVTSSGERVLKFRKLQVNGKTIAVPQDFDDFPVGYTITPDGQKSLVIGDNGIWLVDAVNNQLLQLSSNSFNGESYEELARESIDLYGENI